VKAFLCLPCRSDIKLKFVDLHFSVKRRLLFVYSVIVKYLTAELRRLDDAFHHNMAGFTVRRAIVILPVAWTGAWLGYYG
jgi:hypothetical protein